jgi:hypothetical protein
MTHPTDPRLASFVRHYNARVGRPGLEQIKIALPARSTVILEFYFATPHLIEIRASGERDHAAWAVAVGPQTFARVNLILSGVTDVFTVTFEQTGLYAVKGRVVCLSAVAQQWQRPSAQWSS